MQNIIIFLIILMIGACRMDVYAQDQLTVTTFYPAPYGVYDELRAKHAAVGDTYYDPGQYGWSSGKRINAGADLVVENNVGIGMVSPQAKLDINTIVSGINRRVRISGGSPAEGRSLMSDANGVGSWSDKGFYFLGYEASSCYKQDYCSVQCPSGYLAVSGGWRGWYFHDVRESKPLLDAAGDPRGWRVYNRGNASQPRDGSIPESVQYGWDIYIECLKE